jgi:hypothetical protein
MIDRTCLIDGAPAAPITVYRAARIALFAYLW